MPHVKTMKRRTAVAHRIKIITGICLVLAVTLVLGGLFVKQQETLSANAQAAGEFVAKTPTIVPFEVVPELVVIGDSMSAGSNNTVVWPELVGDELEIKTTVLATGGAAYTQERKPLLDQVEKAIKLQPTMVIVAGTVGDRKSDSRAIAAAASDVIAALREGAPEATVIVVGPLWDSSDTSSGVLQVNDTLRATADELGVPFWDAIAEGWLTDRNLIQSDRLHPTDDGQRQIAARIAEKASAL